MKKVTMILLLCFSLLLILQPVSSVRAADYFDEIAVKVVLNGEEIQFEPTAIVWNVTTLVPFRQLFEAYDAEVEWDPVTKQVTANKGDTTIVITMDSFQAWVNGKEYKLTQTPFVAKDTAYINLRFVSEAMGATVNFSKKDRTVFIDWTAEEK